MKSVTFLFLMVLAIVKLGGASAESRCPAVQPRAVHHGRARTVALATVPDEPRREPAEGLPVPIYPGTRVTEAELLPPHTRATEHDDDDRGQPFLAPEPNAGRVVIVTQTRHEAEAGTLPGTVTGLISATEDRARQDARIRLGHQVTTWLAPDVPAAWKPPAPLIDRLIVATKIKPIEKDYGTLYEAVLTVDASPPRRAEIVAAYHHDLVVRRMAVMGGALAAVLTCLAAVAGYIRADEATRGYYTNRLRIAAAAGVGAAGVVIYRLLA